MTERLTGQDLCLLRGDRCLFRALSFDVGRGELLAIEGPNGCGKTSLLRGIAGLLDFETGAVHWNGAPVRDDFQSFRADIVWFAHRPGLKLDLTLVENLQFECTLRASRPDRLDAVVDRLDLRRLTGLPLRYLSAGQQRRVALARMLLSTGRLWMMDEPLTNLDRKGHALVAELIDEHLADGGLCAVASHHTVGVSGPVKRLELA